MIIRSLERYIVPTPIPMNFFFHRRTDSNRIKLKTLILVAFFGLSTLWLPASISPTEELKYEGQTKYHTSNNTINDSATQTLLSGFNTTSNVDVVGVFDSQANSHVVWSQFQSNSLIYAMFDVTGALKISETILPTNSSFVAISPELEVDSQNRIHLVWENEGNEIKYMIIDPSLDDQNGDSANYSSISLTPPITIADGTGIRSDPDIAVDSNDGMHVVWVDTLDPLGIYYNAPQIYYMMLGFDNSSGLSTIIGQTLLTPSLSQAGYPAVSIGENNTVVVVWEDTHGSTVEYVGILDTSGSMNAEWSDMCVVFYGGNFASGGTFQGLKPMLNTSGITVYETLYALSGNWPSAATSGNCQTAYATGGSGNQGPRTTALGLAPNDDSGGIRELNDVVYNNGSINLPTDGGYYSEFWGPGSTWACLSWEDINGNVPGNPPTQLDHHWNPNATKVIVPVSDEGPYGGSPAQQSDDIQSINEAHDACVNAGIVPLPLNAAGFGTGSTDVGSHMMDLAQCPNGFQSLSTRTCDGSTVRLTDAGGVMYNFPTSASNSAEMQLMVEKFVELTASSGATEIFLTVLDPYSFINNPRSGWYLGDSGTEIDFSSSRYVEHIGASIDSQGYGNLVIVNDTKLTNTSGWSQQADVDVDSLGNIHVTWVDSRGGVPDDQGPSQLHYLQLDPNRLSEADGSPNGLDLNDTITVIDTALDSSNLTWSFQPRVDADRDGSVHLTWIETDEYQADLRWIHIQGPQSNSAEQLPLGGELDDAYSLISSTNIASGSSSLMGFYGDNFNAGSHPIINFNWPIRQIMWTSDDCSTSNSDADIGLDLCMWASTEYSMELSVQLGQEDYIILEPNQVSIIHLNLKGINIPNGGDIVQISMTDTPDYWTDIVGFNSNYQSNSYLLHGGEIPVELFLRSPTVRQIDADQIFDIEIIVESTSYDFTTTSIIIHVNLTNPGDWDDDDGDGIGDSLDDCPWGAENWVSEEWTDHDSDGCKDSTEDSDDDNDGIIDENDGCPTGYLGYDMIDQDQDGCDDRFEDSDLDQDGIVNNLDSCPQGAMHWDSTDLGEDHDQDGCRDSDEDENDDNDLYLDSQDSCPAGLVGWNDSNLDYDTDGCQDLSEDDDDDNDGVRDPQDSCARGNLGWLSSPNTDHDGDGCRDLDEDPDFDNDGVLNEFDSCPYSQIGWLSSVFNDWDGDGCLDIDEDSDDDNDGYADEVDSCPRSEQNSATLIDRDLDGCYDLIEDDLDNDGISSTQDNCENNPLTLFESTEENDHDSDGCEDSLEDLDDDGDGVNDEIDQCLLSPMISFRPDLDNDGCIDSIEDEDNDGDGILNEKDNCPDGEIGWISSKKLDSDGDGCRDSTEDDEVAFDFLNFFRNNPPMLMFVAILLVVSLGVILSRSGNVGHNRQSIISQDERRMRKAEAEDKLWNDVEDQIDSIIGLNEDSTPKKKVQKTKSKKSANVSKLISKPKKDSKALEEKMPKTFDSEDAAEWLKLADELEQEGKDAAAKECRKTAMALLRK
jgi:hypothetical protein